MIDALLMRTLVLTKLFVIAISFIAEQSFAVYHQGSGSSGGGIYRGNHLSLDPHHSDNRRCEEITIPMCRGIGYNMTYVPNQFNHVTQEEAGLEVHQFWPLVEIACSPDLRFFLCSLYFPICTPNYDRHLPVCKPVCERARAGCEPLMRKYGFEWPDRMKCDRLPVAGTEDQLCMDDNNRTASSTTPPPTKRPPQVIGHNGIYPATPEEEIEAIVEPGIEGSMQEIWNAQCKCDCRGSFVRIKGSLSQRKSVTIANISNCATPCNSPYFSRGEQNFAVFWIGLWSVLCCVSTLMTVSTFLIEMERFRYPERPIIFLSFCYLMISVGYIIRLGAGHEAIACDGPVVRTNTTDPAICTVVFLLIYFFSMASSIWWVVLSFTWFLSAGLKWSTEAISKYSSYFHAMAWAIPSIKSVAILAMSAVDGDSLVGVCFVGNADVSNLRGFVLIPLFVYLVIGAVFLFTGFISLFRIRNVIKQQGHSKTDKLEKLMIRIGVFTILYTVPATILIACYFYEQHYRYAWELSASCPCLDGGSKPDFSIFMVKYFMCLVVGITSGIWIWSHKTVDSWRRFYRRVCCCCLPRHADHIYQPAEAIIIKSHTDISSGYNPKYPLSHV